MTAQSVAGMMDLFKESLQSTCRLCLTKVDDPSTMQPLEDEEEGTVWNASVRSFTLKKPMCSTVLPNKMCSYCAEWITKLIHFRLQCVASERLLISLLKHYKEQIEKGTAMVRVGEQQWGIPMHNAAELLSRYEDHLSRLRKGVLFAIMHMDRCTTTGQPVLTYRKAKVNQFYAKFVNYLRRTMDLVNSTNDEGVITSMLDITMQQSRDGDNMPIWAQEVIGDQFWDGLVETCCSKFVQSDNRRAPSGEQSSSQYSLPQAVLSQSSGQSTACSEKSQMPTVIQLVELHHQRLNMPISVQPKQAELPAMPTSQTQRVVTSKPQDSSKQGGENIQNLQKSAATQKLNSGKEGRSSNIMAQQQVSPKPSAEFVQPTNPAQNANVSQAVQPKTSKVPPVQLTSPTQNLDTSQAIQAKTSKVHPVQLTSPTQNLNTSQAVQAMTSKLYSVQLTSPTQNLNTSQAVQAKTSKLYSVQLTSPTQNLNTSQAVQAKTSKLYSVQLTSPTQNLNTSQTVQGKTPKSQPVQVTSSAQNTNVSQAVQGIVFKCQRLHLASPAQNTNAYQAVLDKTYKSQSDTQLSKSAGVSVPLELQNLQNQALQSSVIDDVIDCTQDIQKPMEQLTIVQRMLVEHSYALRTSSSAKKKSVEGSQCAQVFNRRCKGLKNEAKKIVESKKTVIKEASPGVRSKSSEKQESQGVLKKTSDSQETAKETLRLQEVNRAQEQMNKTGSKEVRSKATNRQKETNKIQKSHGQMNKTSEFQISETLQRGSEQSEVQMSAHQAAEAGLKNKAKKIVESKKTVIKEASPGVRSKSSEKQESQGVLKKTSDSQETAKETLRLQEVNRAQEQMNKTGSKEVRSKATNLQKETSKIQKSHGQMNKTSEFQISENLQRGSEQSEVQTSAHQAAEANKSASSSSGEEISPKSTETSTQRTPEGAATLAESLKLNFTSLIKTNSREVLGLSEDRWRKLIAAVADPSIFRSNWWLIKSSDEVSSTFNNSRAKEEQKKEALPVRKESEPAPNITMSQLTDNIHQSEGAASSEARSEAFNNVRSKSSPVSSSSSFESDSDSSDSWQPPASKRRRNIFDKEDDYITEVENLSVRVTRLHPGLPGCKEPESTPNVILQPEVAAFSKNCGETEKPCDFQSKVTKNNAKHQGSPVSNCNSWQPPAKKVKVWQLKPHQLAPYVSVTKLNPDFFRAGRVYNLKDFKVATMSQRLSMVVRKPGTVGKRINSVFL